MLGGGTRQAAGVTTPPSPGPEHAEHPWMQKADTPMSYLNETLRALLGFKYAFSQPDLSCPVKPCRELSSEPTPFVRRVN